MRKEVLGTVELYLNPGLPGSAVYDLSTVRHLPLLLHPRLSQLQFSSSAPVQQPAKSSSSFLRSRSGTLTHEPPTTGQSNSSWPGSSAPGIRTSRISSPSRSPHISKRCTTKLYDRRGQNSLVGGDDTKVRNCPVREATTMRARSAGAHQSNRRLPLGHVADPRSR